MHICLHRPAPRNCPPVAAPKQGHHGRPAARLSSLVLRVFAAYQLAENELCFPLSLSGSCWRGIQANTPFGRRPALSAASELSLGSLQEHQLCYRNGWAAAPAWQPGGGYEPVGAHPWEHARRPDGYTGRVSAPMAPPAVGWGGQCIESGSHCQQSAAGFGRGSAGAFHRRVCPSGSYSEPGFPAAC